MKGIFSGEMRPRSSFPKKMPRGHILGVLCVLCGFSVAVGAAELPRGIVERPTALSADTAAEVGRLQAELEAGSVTARRLAAESGVVPRRARRLSGDPVAYVYARAPYLAFDPSRLRAVSEWEFQLLLAREMALASLDLPLDLPEGRDAARAREAQVALELSAGDKPFGKKLRALARADARVLEAGERGELQRPQNELEREALDLALLARGRDGFLSAVEAALPPDPDRVWLTELEDFVALNGPGFGGAQLRAGDPYVWIGGRRYPARLLKAAQPLVESGGVRRARESLDGFETTELPLLCRRARRWLR